MYINLDHREDRNLEMERELNRIGINLNKVMRIPAVYCREFGAVGCAKSHINCLTKAIKAGMERVLILEDDFDFCSTRTFSINMNALMTQLPTYWDVVLFSAGFQEGKSHSTQLCRVTRAFSTTGYLVNGQEYMR